MFARSPQTQVESNLEDEMNICIKELSRKNNESEKDKSDHSVNEQRIGSNYSRGTERQGDENNHLCSPDKQKCEFNYSDTAETQENKSNDSISLSGHNNNGAQVSPPHKINSGQVSGKNTAGIGNESHDINPALDHNSEKVNNGFSS